MRPASTWRAGSNGAVVRPLRVTARPAENVFGRILTAAHGWVRWSRAPRILDQVDEAGVGDGLYRELFRRAPVAIAVVRRDLEVVDANPELGRVCGRVSGELGGGLTALLGVGDESSLRAAAEAAATCRSDASVVVEHSFAKAAGQRGWARTTIRRLDQNPAAGDQMLVCVVEDVTSHQEALQQQRREAERDPLTGLFNRRGGDRRLRAALERMVMSGPVAVIICDADGLKEANDRLGHAAGDEMLVRIAARLRAAVRASDDVARLGGDEFIVVARVTGPAEAEAIAERCVATVRSPKQAGASSSLTISAGVAVAYPGGITDPAALIAAADTALYEAKRRGRDRWHRAD